MILKGPISLDKNLPKYIFKFNVALISFFAAWFVLCVPAMLIVGGNFGESHVTYITMGVLFASFFVGLLIFYAVALKLRARYIDECANELEERFADMPLDEAEESLKQRGIITDCGFVFNRDGVFGDEVVPFEKIRYYVWASTHELINVGHSVKAKRLPKIAVDAYLNSSDGSSEQELILPLDRALFNFLSKSDNIKVTDARLEYLKRDKKNFCREAFGFKAK